MKLYLFIVAGITLKYDFLGTFKTISRNWTDIYSRDIVTSITKDTSITKVLVVKLQSFFRAKSEEEGRLVLFFSRVSRIVIMTPRYVQSQYVDALEI